VYSFARFAAVNTKIRALESRFLSNEDFKNLLHRKSIADIAAYLKKETHYQKVLGDINENQIQRGHLEALIRKDHAREIGEISHYLYDGYRKFFTYVFVKREIEDLKKMLRSIKNGKIGMLSKDLFPHLCRLNKVNVDTLLRSKNIDEFIKSLRGTVYYKYLQPLEEGSGDKSIFMGEMLLDLAYFDIFYKNLHEIEKKDRKIVDKIQGTNVDLLNIQWIYRGLKYYNLPREILFNYTIPHGTELSIRDIKELCYTKSIDEFQQRILNTRYNFLFDNESIKDIFMERRMLRYQYYNTNRLKKQYKMDITGIIAFDILLEYEIRDLITVIESIRYNMPFDEAKKFLIRKL